MMERQKKPGADLEMTEAKWGNFSNGLTVNIPLEWVARTSLMT